MSRLWIVSLITLKSVARMLPIWHDGRMPKESKWLAFFCLAIVVALYAVGTLRHGVLRNVLQTLPLWVPIVLGFRGSEFAKWSALPCLIIWLAAMMIVWLLLFRWVYVQSWHFSPTEIAITFIVGVASAAGSPLAYGDAPVHGRRCCSAARSAAVSGTLGEFAAGYCAPMTIEKFKNVHDLVVRCVWGLDHVDAGEFSDERRIEVPQLCLHRPRAESEASSLSLHPEMLS